MKKLLFTLALLISFGSHSQSENPTIFECTKTNIVDFFGIRYEINEFVVVEKM